MTASAIEVTLSAEAADSLSSGSIIKTPESFKSVTVIRTRAVHFADLSVVDLRHAEYTSTRRGFTRTPTHRSRCWRSTTARWYKY